MTEEYLLAWNDHHATFFSAMSDLVTGGVFVDTRKPFEAVVLMVFEYSWNNAYSEMFIC